MPITIRYNTPEYAEGVRDQRAYANIGVANSSSSPQCSLRLSIGLLLLDSSQLSMRPMGSDSTFKISKVFEPIFEDCSNRSISNFPVYLRIKFQFDITGDIKTAGNSVNFVYANNHCFQWFPGIFKKKTILCQRGEIYRCNEISC